MPDKQALSAITVFNKYAKFLPAKGRRENWAEIVGRNEGMHVAKFPHLESIDIDQVFELNGDAVDLSAEAACAGGACELVR